MTKKELIDQINTGKRSLSFSGFNNFFESPSHFLNYYLEPSKTTDAMFFGTVMHSIILEPDTFEEKYFISENFKLNTNIGKAIYDKALQEANGRTIIQKDLYLKAIKLKTIVWNNKPAHELLMQLTETEKHIKFNWAGWNWTGYIDGIGTEIIVDLKKVADANPWTFRRTFFRMGYHRQAFLYLHGSNSLRKRKYFIIAFDESSGVSVHFVDESAIISAEAELEQHLLYLKECILLDRWDENYDFYCPNDSGIFNITKTIKNVSND